MEAPHEPVVGVEQLMRRGPGSLSGFSRGLLLQGNVKTLAIAGLFTGTYVGMLNTTLQPFTLTLGLGVTGLGLMQAIGNRVGGLSGSLIQPFAGRLADLHGRRLVITIGSIVTISSMLSFLVAALARSWFFLIPGYLLYGLSLLSSPASQAVIAESVNMERKKMGVAFSTVFFFNSVPGGIMAFVAGLIADTLGYYLVFFLAMVLESVNLLLYLTGLKETKRTLTDNGVSGSVQSLRSLVALRREFRGFFATFAVDAFSFGIAGTILYGMMVKEFGYSSTDIGLIVGTLSIAIVLAQYPATKLLLRFGPKKSLALSEFLSVLLLVGWNLSNLLPYFIFLSVLFGVSIATWVPAQQSMLMAVAPPEERSSLSGKLAAFRGIIAFPAPIIGGLLYDGLGYHAPVTVSLLGIVIALSMIMKLLPDERVKSMRLETSRSSL